MISFFESPDLRSLPAGRQVFQSIKKFTKPGLSLPAPRRSFGPAGRLMLVVELDGYSYASKNIDLMILG
jgi:hypothetical protein